MHQPYSLQSGFTLVEIAVVIVIIGLLLGGILKGQELINSARVRNLLDQKSGIQAAYFGFIDRYRQVPGDMTAAKACGAIGASNFVNGCVGGNGNGQLDQEDVGEAAALWAQLSAAGFISGAYEGGITRKEDYNNGAKSITPVNVFNGPVMLTRTDNYLHSTTPPVRLAFIFGNNIPVNVLYELDIKIDDGSPNSGILRHAKAPSGGAGGASDGISDIVSSAPQCVSGGASWNIDGGEQNCSAVYFY